MATSGVAASYAMLRLVIAGQLPNCAGRALRRSGGRMRCRCRTWIPCRRTSSPSPTASPPPRPGKLRWLDTSSHRPCPGQLPSDDNVRGSSERWRSGTVPPDDGYGWAPNCGSIVNNCCARPTPRSAKRPTDTRFARSGWGVADANSDDMAGESRAAPDGCAAVPDSQRSTVLQARTGTAACDRKLPGGPASCDRCHGRPLAPGAWRIIPSARVVCNGPYCEWLAIGSLAGIGR